MQVNLINMRYMTLKTRNTRVGLHTQCCFFNDINVLNVWKCLYVEPVIILDATDALTAIFWGVIFLWFLIK